VPAAEADGAALAAPLAASLAAPLAAPLAELELASEERLRAAT